MTHMVRPGSNDTVSRAVVIYSFKRMDAKGKSKVELSRDSCPNTIVLHNSLPIPEVTVCHLDPAVKTT